MVVGGAGGRWIRCFREMVHGLRSEANTFNIENTLLFSPGLDPSAIMAARHRRS